MTILNFNSKNVKAKNLISVCFAIAITFLCSAGIKAQSQWLDYDKGNSISLEIYKPVIPTKILDTAYNVLTPEYSAGSLAFFLSGRYVISKEFSLVADIPFANGELDDSLLTDKGGFKFGNPYLGAEYNLPETPVMVELGFRIPVASKDNIPATLLGVRSDIDRSEAFLYDIVPVYAAVNYESVSDSRILLKARFGADIWFNTKSVGFDTQPALFAEYTLQTGYLNKYVHFIVGLSGRYDVNSGPKFPQKENFLQYGLLVTFPLKNVHPGFIVKFPGGETNDFLNYVLGLNCTYGF